MAAFPAYVKLGWRDGGEMPTSVVLRSEMERGIAKQRRFAADRTVTMDVTAYFDSAADATNFETWVDSTIDGGASAFDFVVPRSGATVSARIVGGDIGKLVPSNRMWSRTMRSFKVEWQRSAI